MEYQDLTNQEESITRMAARKFTYMLSKGLEFGDLLQEGRLAILDLQKKGKRTTNPRILYTTAYRGILRECLSYSTKLPHNIAVLTNGINSEDQLDELVEKIKNNKKYNKYIHQQYTRLKKKIDITEEQLYRHKARVILKNSLNMRNIEENIEEVKT